MLFRSKEADYSHIQKIFIQVVLDDIKKHWESSLEIFIKNYYENGRERFKLSFKCY